ncbi:MAG: hypothetical protein ACI8P9_004665 [Parasphingorhabdus sp.]|jgi:hypothetical protein
MALIIKGFASSDKIFNSFFLTNGQLWITIVVERCAELIEYIYQQKGAL